MNNSDPSDNRSGKTRHQLEPLHDTTRSQITTLAGASQPTINTVIDKSASTYLKC